MTRHDDKYEHVPPAAEQGAAPWCRGQVTRTWPVLLPLRAVPTLSTVSRYIKGRGAECVTIQDTKDRGGTVCDKTRTQTKEIRSRVECWAESSDCNDSRTLTLSLMCGTLTAVSKGNPSILH